MIPRGPPKPKRREGERRWTNEGGRAKGAKHIVTSAIHRIIISKGRIGRGFHKARSEKQEFLNNPIFTLSANGKGKEEGKCLNSTFLGVLYEVLLVPRSLGFFLPGPPPFSSPPPPFFRTSGPLETAATAVCASLGRPTDATQRTVRPKRQSSHQPIRTDRPIPGKGRKTLWWRRIPPRLKSLKGAGGREGRAAFPFHFLLWEIQKGRERGREAKIFSTHHSPVSPRGPQRKKRRG